MYSITNIPTAASRYQIKALVHGETIEIRQVQQPGTMGLGMTSMYVGDHMLVQPEALRQMIGNAVAFAVEAGCEAGYAQAQYDIRRALNARVDDR